MLISPEEISVSPSRTRRTASSLVAVICVLLEVSAVAGFAQSTVPSESRARSISTPDLGYHRTLASPMPEAERPTGEAMIEAEHAEAEVPEPAMPPTRSSFLAKWRKVSGATGYRIDVSTTPSFDSYVAHYGDLNVGNVTSTVITGLKPGTKYYYRVRPDSAAWMGGTSDTISSAPPNTTPGPV